MDETKNVVVEAVEEIIPDTTDVEVTITELPPMIKRPGFGRYIVIGAGILTLAGLAYVGIKKLTKKAADPENYDQDDEDYFEEPEEFEEEATAAKPDDGDKASKK